MNLGKPIFVLFAVLAFLSALWWGLPPIGLIETLLWVRLVLSTEVRAPNGTDIYKVRFQQWRGWMDADYLTLDVY
jgi:hypothetical protein